MGKYKVVSDCYVPVGTGFRYKRSGQVVTLSDDAAVLVAEHIEPVDCGEESAPEKVKPKRKGVAKRNTPVVEEVVEPPVEEPGVVWSSNPFSEGVAEEPVEVVDVVESFVQEVAVEEVAVEEVVEGVTSDVGDPQAGHE